MLKMLLPGVLLLCCLTACSHSSKQLTPSENLLTIANEKHSGETTFHYNQSGTAVLCINEYRQKTFPAQPRPSLRFFVYHVKTETILYEDTIDQGSVTWLDDKRLEMQIIPGNVSEDGENYTWLYNLETGEKTLKPQE